MLYKYLNILVWDFFPSFSYLVNVFRKIKVIIDYNYNPMNRALLFTVQRVYQNVLFFATNRWHYVPLLLIFSSFQFL